MDNNIKWKNYISCKKLVFQFKDEVEQRIQEVLEDSWCFPFPRKTVIYNYYLKFFWWFLDKYLDFYNCFEDKEEWGKSKIELKKSLCSLKQALKVSKQEEKITWDEYSFFASFFNRTRRIFNKNIDFLVLDFSPRLFQNDLLYTYNRFENPNIFYPDKDFIKKIDFQRFMFKIFLLYEFYAKWNKWTFLRFKLDSDKFNNIVKDIRHLKWTEELIVKYYSFDLIKDYENKKLFTIEPFSYYVCYLKEIWKKFNYTDEDYSQIVEKFDLFYKKKITNYELFEALYNILI